MVVSPLFISQIDQVPWTSHDEAYLIHLSSVMLFSETYLGFAHCLKAGHEKWITIQVRIVTISKKAIIQVYSCF